VSRTNSSTRTIAAWFTATQAVLVAMIQAVKDLGEEGGLKAAA
jgi:hypothetical protein